MAIKKYNHTVGEFELRRKETAQSFEKVKIVDSKQSAAFARQFYHDDIDIYESFFLILLNRAGFTIGFVKISQGGIAGTVVDSKLVAKCAIESLSSSVILVHNHPSGRKEPSNQDHLITKQIKEGLRLFDIPVLDHLILTQKEYYSFADEGIL